MSKIVLRSDDYKITKILRKTRAWLFADIRVGDVIRFSMTVSNRTGASGGGSYASYIRIENVTQGTSTVKSQSELSNILSDTFELEREAE